MDRANTGKENMGLTTWRNAPKGKIVKSDISVAKSEFEKYRRYKIVDNWKNGI